MSNYLVKGEEIVPIDIGQAEILAGTRVIQKSDESALFPCELRFVRDHLSRARDQCGAARLTARTLLRRLGYDAAPIRRSSSGAPIWPSGIVGSLAHDETTAAASIASDRLVRALGIDVEPYEPLPADIVHFVLTRWETRRYSSDRLQHREIFVLKEAVFKAFFPLYNISKGFTEINVDLELMQARINGFKEVYNLRLIKKNNIIGLAYIMKV